MNIEIIKKLNGSCTVSLLETSHRLHLAGREFENVVTLFQALQGSNVNVKTSVFVEQTHLKRIEHIAK